MELRPITDQPSDMNAALEPKTAAPQPASTDDFMLHIFDEQATAEEPRPAPANAKKRPRESERDQPERAPKRGRTERRRDPHRFQNTAADEHDAHVTGAAWCGVEVTRVTARVRLPLLRLPIYGKYFGQSTTPQYARLKPEQRARLTAEAQHHGLSCALEWATDTKAIAQTADWTIQALEGRTSTHGVQLVPAATPVIEQGTDWHVVVEFNGFRARTRAPLRLRLVRASATGADTVLDVTLPSTCWQADVTQDAYVTQDKHVTHDMHVTEDAHKARDMSPRVFRLHSHQDSVASGNAEYYYDPRTVHTLTLAANLAVTPVTPELSLTFRTVTQMTELMSAVSNVTQSDSAPGHDTASLAVTPVKASESGDTAPTASAIGEYEAFIF